MPGVAGRVLLVGELGPNLEVYFIGAGVSSRFAPTGAATIAMMQTTPFHVVVSPGSLPDMDGATLVRTLLRQFPDVVAVLYATGVDDADLAGWAKRERFARLPTHTSPGDAAAFVAQAASVVAGRVQSAPPVALPDAPILAPFVAPTPTLILDRLASEEGSAIRRDSGLEAQLIAIDAENVKLQMDLARTRAALDVASKEREHFKSELEGISRVGNELSNARTEIARLNEIKQTISSEHAVTQQTLQAERAARAVDAAELLAARAGRTADAGEIQRLHDALNANRATITSLEQEQMRAQEARKLLEHSSRKVEGRAAQLAQEAEDAARRVEEAKRETHEARQLRDDAELQLANVEEQLVDAKAHLENARRESAAQVAAIQAAAQARVEAVKREGAAELAAAHARVEDVRRDLSARLAEAESQLADARRELESAQTYATWSQRDREQAKQALTAAVKQRDDNAAALAALKDELVKTRSAAARLNGEAEASRRAAASGVDQLDALEEKVDRLTKERDNALRALTEASMKLMELEDARDTA